MHADRTIDAATYDATNNHIPRHMQFTCFSNGNAKNQSFRVITQ